MIRAITIHALERLQQRRGCVHTIRHINKVNKAMPKDFTDGIFERKGWRYVIRGDMLVTVLPPKKSGQHHEGTL